MPEYSDKVALVTGAGQGIGRQVAKAFAALGTLVAANDINPLNLDETVTQIQQAGGTARPYIFDVAKRMPIEGMVAQVLEHFGRIDILVNHASVYPDASLLEMDEWEFHRTLDVNLGGPFFTMQKVGLAMQQQGGGTIINLVSTARQAQPIKGSAAIRASQAGLLGLTISAAGELAEHRIRVNALCYGPRLPGVIQSTSLNPSIISAWQETHREFWMGEYPQLVGTLLYLCSEGAASLTGQVICVDTSH